MEKSLGKGTNEKNIYLIYIILFAVFIFKMYHYSNEGYTVPDSRAQLSYLIYMEKNEDVFVPKFEDITMYKTTATVMEGNEQIDRMEPYNATCYLGHPPLYYKIMQLCGTVEVDESGVAYVNYTKLANCNIILTALTMLIALMTGYQLLREKKCDWSMHLFFAAICTTLPLYGYVGSGLNNDNLCNLGVVVFWVGLMNYLRKGYSYKTFWLVALGIAITMMGKLTAGLIVAVATVIMVLADIIKTKKLGIIANKHFLSSLPVYVGVLIYYLKIYMTYGGVQPAYSQISSIEEFQSSGFYVNEADRLELTFIEIVERFFSGVWETWKATYNSDYMVVREGVLSIAYAVVLILFVGYAIYELVVFVKEKGKSNNVIAFAFLAAILVTMATHFKTFYSGYISRGYLGANQARYYMACIPVIAFAACEGATVIKQHVEVKLYKYSKVVLTLLSVLLVYSDYIHYVLNIHR